MVEGGLSGGNEVWGVGDVVLGRGKWPRGGPDTPRGGSWGRWDPGCWVPGLDFPRRPPWSFAMSPEELRVKEEAAFGTFLRALREGRCPRGAEEGGTDGDDDGGDVAPFEHNLEVRGDTEGT